VTANWLMLAGVMAIAGGFVGAMVSCCLAWSVSDSVFVPLTYLCLAVCLAGCGALLVGGGMWLATQHTLHVGGAS
jgi:hypothetical protein